MRRGSCEVENASTVAVTSAVCGALRAVGRGNGKEKVYGSIVAAIAEAHGGTVDLQARSPGGLRVTISLPSPLPRLPAVMARRSPFR